MEYSTVERLERKGIMNWRDLLTITISGPEGLDEEGYKAEIDLWCEEHGVELRSFDPQTRKTVITWDNSDFTSLTLRQIKGRLKLLDKLAAKYEEDWRFK